MDRSLDGWLSKLAKTKSSRGTAPMWQRRWFTLRGDQLCFFNTEQDATANSIPKWSLDLGTHGAMASLYDGEPPDPTRIELRAGDEVDCEGEKEDKTGEGKPDRT